MTIPAAVPSRRGGPSLRWQLAQFALALSLPILAFVGFLLLHLAASERTRVEAGALDKARNMALAVDRELGGFASALNVLASSPALRAGDWEGFHRQASEVRDRTGYWTVLRDLRTGQQIVNTRLPWGAPLPTSNVPETGETELRARGVMVSDLFNGAVARAPLFTVQVPVERGGEPPLVLALSVPAEAIRDVLVSEQPPEGWIAAVVDRGGRVLARMPRHEQHVGRTATAEFLAHVTGREGTWRGLTLEGEPIFWAYARSRLSDWRVSVGVREAELAAPLRASLAWLAGLGGVVLLLSTLLALSFSRRISGPIRALAARALALGRGEAIEPAPARFKEVDQVNQALVTASAHLRSREEERDRAEARLRESEARMRLILESARDVAIITISLNGTVTGWNTGAQTLLGWPAAEAVGRPLDLIFTPEDREAGVPATEMGKALKEGRAPDERWHLRRDGSRFFAIGALLPMRDGLDGAGVVTGFLKILGDRTKEQEAEGLLRDTAATLERLVAERTAELESANERLLAEMASRERAEEQLRQAQKMEAVGRLTGGIAHDFNNLLTIITGSLDMLRRRVNPDDARVSRLIDHAIEGANRAAALTYRLLAFSRLHPLAPEPVDANKLVAGMSDLLRRTLGENIAVETVLAGGLWRTHADPNQLENALLNLAVNARDAMPDGGKLTIETANAHLDEAYAATRPEVSPGQYVLIAVCDTGSGMTPEVMAKVFEPFFTTKPVGKGTGLGLSQVYGFAKQSGGHVAVYSEPGHGSTVKLYLPRFRQAGEVETRTAEVRRPATPALTAARAGETVLVVEDEAMVREFSVSALEEAGYRVLGAEDGPSGLALLDAHPDVALLFTDVVLTGPMNGRKVADEATRRRPDLKVLFTTGYTRNAIIHHGRLDEGVNLIGKPFTAADLAAKVRQVLDAG